MHADTGASLPVLERLAPPPSPSVLADRIEQHTGQGDVVVDLFGRGGWVARAALDRQRRSVSIESSPLTRLLAEVVLRPPDVRHLDAAFQGLAASPRRESSLKVSIGDMFATRCATCSRTLTVDEFTWSVDDEAGIAGTARPVLRHYRCAVCRDQIGGGEHRQAPLDVDDRRRASADVGAAAARTTLRARFPDVAGAEGLADELLDLHTPRQLVALCAIMERIESDLRAAPVLAALRLALLHTILPASRLAAGPGRASALRVSSGHVRLPARDAVPRTRPVAGVRGRVPPGPRLRPASRRRRPRPGPGTSGRGPPQPGRRPCDHGHRVDRVERIARRARRPGRLRSVGPDPAGPPGSRPATDAPEPRAPRRRVPRDRLGPWPRGDPAPAGRRTGRCLAPDPVALAGGPDRPRPRCGRTGHGPRRPGRPARRWGSGGARGRGRRWRDRRLPAPRGTPEGPRRRCDRSRGARAARRPDATRCPDPGERRAPVAARRRRRRDGRAGSRPVHTARARRRASVLGRRRRPDRDRDGGRDPQGAGRTGDLRAAPRRDPGWPRPRGPAPSPGRCDDVRPHPERDGRARRNARERRRRRRRRGPATTDPADPCHITRRQTIQSSACWP